MHADLIKKIISNAGISLIEAMVSLAILAIGGLGLTYLTQHMNAGTTNSKAQFGAQSLRVIVSATITDPVACTQAISKVAFNPGQADISVAGNLGYPLKFKLVDKTIIDGSAPGKLTNYSVNLDGFTFQTNGPAVAIPGLVDTNAPAGCSNNSVYIGDVSLFINKGVNGAAVDGGNTLSNQLLGTLLLTVDNVSGNICRCYSADPCVANGGSFSPINNPKCSLCPANNIWVGNDVVGAPICVPICTVAGQFLVSDGAGGAVCKTPDCPAANLNWAVGGVGCSGPVALTPASALSGPIASTNGNNGSATFTCSATGTWPALPNAGATCAAPVNNCPAMAAMPWAVGGVACSGPVLATAPSTNSAAINSINGNNGSATFACDAAGVWAPVPNAGATCSAPVGNCPPQAAMSWSVAGVACAGPVGATPPSTTSFPIASNNGNNGSATFTCSAAGTWPAAPDAGATCAQPPGNCPVSVLIWTVAGVTCSGPVGSTASSTVSAPIASTNGSAGTATFTCSAAGAWPALPDAGATCTAATGCCNETRCSGFFCVNVPQPGLTQAACLALPLNDPGDTNNWAPGSCGFCPAQNLSWTVGGKVCSGPAPISGPTVSSGPIASTNGTAGSATFTCSAAGNWPAAPDAGATCGGGSGTWVVVACCQVNLGGCAVTLPVCQGPMIGAAVYAGLIGQPCAPLGSWMSTPGPMPVLQSASAQCQ